MFTWSLWKRYFIIVICLIPIVFLTISYKHRYNINYLSKSSNYDWLIETIRRDISNELPNHNSIEFPNNQTQPIRALVITTWRSGSTFIGDILNSHPGTYYHYEPLIHFGIKRVRNGTLAKNGLDIIKSLFHCNYDEKFQPFFKYGQEEGHREVFSHNQRLWKHCSRGENQRCWNPKILSEICSLFPYQSMKTVRLSLNLVQDILSDSKLNVKVLLLIRDPRGTMESRKHRTWCPQHSDCNDPKLLCQDLVDDFKSAKKITKQFPNRLKVVRYEDFAQSPIEETKSMIRFFNYQMDENVEKFLSTHTTTNIGGVSSTFRDTKKTPFHWKTDLTYDEIINIQKQCQKAMNLWRYKFYYSQNEINETNSVLSFNEFN